MTAHVARTRSSFARMMRRILVPLVALAATLLAPAAADAAGLAFTRPSYVDQQLAGGEPLVTEDPTRHILLYTSHAGTTHIYRQGLPALTTFTFLGSYRNQVNMWWSKDDGRSWNHVNAYAGFSQDPSQNNGFSDPDLTTDEGGRLYNTGINLANDALFSSNDGGVTWDQGTAQCHDGDRPWLAGGKKDEVFLATNTVTGALGHAIFRSADGGNSCEQEGISSPDGNGKLFYNHATGRLIEPINTDDGGIGVATFKPGDKEAVNHVAVKSTMYAHWPSIALDDDGGVYLVWDDDPRADGTSGGCGGDPTPVPNSIRMVYSPDFGEHWNAPVTIAAPSDRRVFWPWITAGDRGKVNVVWYETNKVVDLACENADISVRTATLLGADTDSPKGETIDPIGRPISTNSNICQSGTTCVATGEDRRLGDFFTNSVDSVGCVLIATADTYSPDPVSGGPRPIALPLFVRQTSGPALRGDGDCSGQSSAENPVTLPASSTTSGGSSSTTTITSNGQRVPCFSRRIIRVSLRTKRAEKIRTARVKVTGKKAQTFKGSKLRSRIINKRRRTRVPVNLQGLGKGQYTVTITATTTKGHKLRAVRRFRTCLP